MNNNKICFIASVDDEALFEENIKYIKSINVPKNMEIDIISVTEEKNIAKSYNEAMKNSEAKYKVYINQGTFITNKNFINDVLEIFNEDQSVGMIGVIGSKSILASGHWRDSTDKYGKIYCFDNNGIKSINYKESDGKYTDVKVVDGCIIITQYDIEWREDILDRNLFFHISQSLEFGLNKYKVVVPNQIQPWCIYQEKQVIDKINFEKCKKIFWKEYHNVLPLVSILIPAYNQTTYLKEALESAINQTYPNIEIIIGDDSTNEEVKHFLEPYLNTYCNITYFRNQRDTMDYGLSNVNSLLKKSNGKYVNYLNHDDVFNVRKIERMMDCFIQNSNITVVTSVRQPIDAYGEKINLEGAFKKLFKEDKIVSGVEMSRIVIKNLINCIGEPTTILFEKKYIDNFGEFNGRQFLNIIDVGASFKLLQHGDIMYLSEPLSYFRIHPDQNSNNKEITIKGIVEWCELALECYKVGIIYNSEEYKSILYKWVQCFIPTLSQFINDSHNITTEVKNKLENTYKYAISKIIN